MPDIVVHNAMGARVLDRLDAEIVIDREIFRFAVMGPDPYLFYRFFAPRFRHGVNERSNLMHRTRTGRFLMELARRSREPEMFSFLAGFLCHYALDSTAHPFIYAKAEYRSDLHTAIEHRLDMIELERQGKRDIMELFTDFPDLPEARAAMKTVYGWDDDCFETAYRHMKLYHRIVQDRHGILNALYPKAVSYRTRLCDGMDLSPFDALEAEAVRLGVGLITAAHRFRAGQIGEEELQKAIGNRSYAGGEADQP